VIDRRCSKKRLRVPIASVAARHSGMARAQMVWQAKASRFSVVRTAERFRLAVPEVVVPGYSPDFSGC